MAATKTTGFGVRDVPVMLVGEHVKALVRVGNEIPKPLVRLRASVLDFLQHCLQNDNVHERLVL
jgi:hypothetical protein